MSFISSEEVMMHTTVVTVSTKIVQEGMFRGPLGCLIQPICLLTGCTAAARSTSCSLRIVFLILSTIEALPGSLLL